MMPDDDWSTGLVWQCLGCTRKFPSEWARDMCQMEHDEDDRDTRRRIAH